MKNLKVHIASIERQLIINGVLKALLLGVSVFLIFGQSNFNGMGLGVFSIFVGLIAAIGFGTFKNQRQNAIQLLHQEVPEMEFSLELLQKDSNLTIADKLQLQRIGTLISPNLSIWKRGLWPFLSILSISVILHFSFSFWSSSTESSSIQAEEHVDDKLSEQNLPSLPVFESAEVKIQYPAYTRISDQTVSNLNVKALKGSILTWMLTFQNFQDLDVFLVNSRNEKLAFQQDSGGFQLREQLLGSGIYSIQAIQNDEVVFQSEFYTLESVEDMSPEIVPEEKEVYKFFFPGNNPKLMLGAEVSDDFLVEEVVIVATLARGRGENVKFRETQIPIPTKFFKSQDVAVQLNLSLLDFQPGDELYYYWTARDNKKPEANTSRSDTFFIKYFDENDDSEEAFAGMAINVLPDYFRSQRQIIIDTEKLIAERNKKSEKDFNFTSNEIGYDQKLLRLRYGQYLGEEFESSAGGEISEGEDGDLLSGYMHLHDQEGEHDPEFQIQGEKQDEHVHESESASSGGVEDLLSEFMHAHDSEEMNTYFEKSTRGALKSALDQMWQAELYLRLFEPEKSLPYQYKALEMLKTVQQKSRVYIKRTGYDPPPIKEAELRLTGKLEELETRLEREQAKLDQQIEPLASLVLGLLEKQDLSQEEKKQVLELGQLWSQRMQNSGIQDWEVLVALQELEQGKLDANRKKILREKLYPLSKNYKVLDPSQFGNSALKKAYLKQNR